MTGQVMLDGRPERGAVLSECGRYRYSLFRRWDYDLPAVLFVMLNPSTADAEKDDVTIKKCCTLARGWGYGGIYVWNLYAWRATKPDDLDRVDDPIGRENEDHLWRLLQGGDVGRIVAAWGGKPGRGKYVNRERSILVGPLYDRLVYALKLTKDGHPWHPLYVRGDTEPIVYQEAGAGT